MERVDAETAAVIMRQMFIFLLSKNLFNPSRPKWIFNDGIAAAVSYLLVNCSRHPKRMVILTSVLDELSTHWDWTRSNYDQVFNIIMSMLAPSDLGTCVERQWFMFDAARNTIAHQSHSCGIDFEGLATGVAKLLASGSEHGKCLAIISSALEELREKNKWSDSHYQEIYDYCMTKTTTP
jgi:hypothetical protein